MRSVWLLVTLTVGFTVGFVLAWQEKTQPPKPSPMDEFVAKVQAELDASGKQLVTEVWAVLQILKDAVKEAPVPLAPMPEFERKIQTAAARIAVSTEATIAHAFIGAIEKTVVTFPEWNIIVFGRVVQFFNASADEVKALREKGLTWASIITGYGIAKAANKPAKEVFRRYETDKAWAKVALHYELKPEKLGAALKGLFP